MCFSKRVRSASNSASGMDPQARRFQPIAKLRDAFLALEAAVAQITAGLGELLVQAMVVAAGDDEPRHHDDGGAIELRIRQRAHGRRDEASSRRRAPRPRRARAEGTSAPADD